MDYSKSTASCLCKKARNKHKLNHHKSIQVQQMILINFQAESTTKAKAKKSMWEGQWSKRPEATGWSSSRCTKSCFSPWLTEEALQNSRIVSGCGAPYTALTDLREQYFERGKGGFWRQAGHQLTGTYRKQNRNSSTLKSSLRRNQRKPVLQEARAHGHHCSSLSLHLEKYQSQ